MFGKIAGALAIGAAVFCCSPANAITVTTYNLVLTPTAQSPSQLSGSGLLVINSAVGPNVTFNFSDNPQLVATLNVTIGGLTFNLLNAWNNVRFQLGVLNNVTAGPILNGVASFTINGTGSQFFNPNTGDFAFDTLSVGSISVTGGGDANGATPLPAALPLFASGAGVLGFLGWRRKKKEQPLAA